MEEHILDMINANIVRIENALKTDISEIKTDLKDLKESQIKLAEVIVKLGNVEDKYNMQMVICKEAKKNIESNRDKIDLIEKRLIPIETFYKNYSEIKIKFIVGVGVALLTGIGSLLINILKLMK